MWFTSLLRSVKHGRGRLPRSGRCSSRKRRSFVPRIEILEARTVLSTLTVLNNLDNGAGSLRDAIALADHGDTIVFDAGLGGQTITLTRVWTSRGWARTCWPSAATTAIGFLTSKRGSPSASPA